MALTTPTYDPKSTATTLANAYIADRQSLLTNQNTAATATGKALSSMSSAMSAFEGVLSKLTLKKSVLANAATFSSTVGTATANTTAAAGNYQFFVDQLATANQASYSNISDTTPMSEAGTINVAVGTTSFAVDLTTADKSADGKLSVKELAAAINAASGNGSKVTASTLTVNGVQQLVLTGTDTGAGNTVSISGTALPAGALKDALALAGNRKDLVVAKDAIVYLGDKATGTKLQQPSNTYTVIDGVTMTFTKAQAAGENPVSLTVGTDSSGTQANVQSFVDGWNALIKTLQGLTAAGDAASGKDAGVFNGDAGVQSLRTRLQAVLRQEVNGVSLVNYGITAQRDGTLALDTARLTKTLAANPTGLDAIMGSASMVTPSGVMGGLDKLMDQWTDSTNGLLKTRRESNSKQTSAIMERQAQLDTQYSAAYTRYLNQFTQLQTLQAQMTNNTSIFDALFGDKSK
ncbi:flagellar filament capping protein FliD [Pseudoduganella plicata]|uniref:Flagellar hook-associated protein 2 n=1 Tax=Pseudoduganella plicata TaxID=321984 RepID=A0A4P7BB54_9BURK|nr:flagellar filament capping protein FliD [Pseudoduganella plicata]QBQ35694.1 lateral flagellar hook-associated protein 2 [Pseudoduganella plicata]GGY95944.1 flagellar hook-associated protein 2 [Pseudoduganella plicata]